MCIRSVVSMGTVLKGGENAPCDMEKYHHSRKRASVRFLRE